MEIRENTSWYSARLRQSKLQGFLTWTRELHTLIHLNYFIRSYLPGIRHISRLWCANSVLPSIWKTHFQEKTVVSSSLPQQAPALKFTPKVWHRNNYLLLNVKIRNIIKLPLYKYIFLYCGIGKINYFRTWHNHGRWMTSPELWSVDIHVEL